MRPRRYCISYPIDRHGVDEALGCFYKDVHRQMQAATSGARQSFMGAVRIVTNYVCAVGMSADLRTDDTTARQDMQSVYLAHHLKELTETYRHQVTSFLSSSVRVAVRTAYGGHLFGGWWTRGLCSDGCPLALPQRLHNCRQRR